MSDEFEIYPEEIEQLQNLREFEIWFNTIDSCVNFDNIDNLIAYLMTIERPEFLLYAMDFKNKYLKNES